jgi:uncharacterized protein YecE (DUF72 family)
MARLFVGTSGWNYSDWSGILYPDDVPKRRWLPYYATQFNTVELNYSFYRLPQLKTYEKWRDELPDGFELAVKVWRAISQAQLSDVDDRWHTFVERALVMGKKLGPFLLQLPPSFNATPEHLERLDHFLKLAARTRSARIAVEFRHSSCFAPEVMDLLRRHDAALVIANSSRYPSPEPAATAPFVYFRFHGPRETFGSSYTDAELREWSGRIRAFLEEGCDAYAYFNNDQQGFAVGNARTLNEMVAWNRDVTVEKRAHTSSAKRGKR